MVQQQTDLLRQVADLYPVASNPGMPLVQLDRADFSLFERDFSLYQNSIGTIEEDILSPSTASIRDVASASADRVTSAPSTNYGVSESFAEYLFFQSPATELLAMQRERRVGEPVAPSLELQLWVLQNGLDITHPRA